MNEQLLNEFNNGHDASDGIGGQPPINFYYIVDKSKTLEVRHQNIKAEMIKTLDAMALLEDQYNNLQTELDIVEKEYMKNLQNIVE